MGSLLEFSKKDGLAGDKVAVADLGEGPGGVPLLIFRPKRGPKGQKIYFGGRDHPPPPPILSQGLDDRGPSLI